MSDKVRKIIVRVLAIVLTMLMILSVCAQFVFAAEEDKAPTTTITVSLKGLTKDFPHTEVLALISNVSTYKSQSVLLRKDKNFTADVDLEDGYYFIYSNKYGWKDQNDDTLVINNNEPYNFYVGKTFDKNRYPEQTFTQSKNISVSLTKANKDIEDELTEIVAQNTVIYWGVKDLIYPMHYIYDMEEFKEALLNSPVAKGELSKYNEDLENNAQSADADSDDKWAAMRDAFSGSQEDDSEEAEPADSEDKNTEKESSNDNQIKIENDNEEKESETSPFGEDVPADGQEEEVEEEHTSFFGYIWQMILDSKLILLILIGSLVGLFIIKRKNRDKLLKQMEEDTYDDSKIE